MRRDHDLIRAIILHIEDYPHGEYPPQLPWIEGYSDEQIGYHCYLILEAGLGRGFPFEREGALSPDARILGLTIKGHEFAEAARNNTVWNRTTAWAKSVGGVSINVLYKQLLVFGAELIRDATL